MSKKPRPIKGGRDPELREALALVFGERSDDETEDARFLRSRLAGHTLGKDAVDVYRDALLELLDRDDIALGRTGRVLLWYTLARVWWPEWWKQEVRRCQTELDRAAVDELAAQLRAIGMRRGSRTLAKSEVARAQGVTVGALHKRRHRRRRTSARRLS